MQTALTRETPIGMMTLVQQDGALVEALFGAHLPDGAQICEMPLLVQAFQELTEYFAGERVSFTVTLNPVGTAFQQRCWQALLAIPYGQTRSYEQEAIAIGNPKACRAVGMANNRNPLPIFIPCHRVVGKKGSLVGYGGGLEIKQKLLQLENNSKG